MKSGSSRRSRRHFLRRLGLSGASLALPLGVNACAEQSVVAPGETGEPPLPPPGAPPELRLGHARIALEQYDVAEQRASVVTSSGAMADPWVQFTSSDESIAIVSPRGIVFGLRPGTAHITVMAEGASSQFEVVVHEAQAIRNSPGASDIVVQGFTSDAINAALRVAAARPGGATVFLPAGLYDITSRIDIPASDIVLRGAGRRATWLIASRAFALQGSMDTIRISGVDRVRIEELGFRYAVNGPVEEYGYANQITVLGSADSRIHRCAFEAGRSASWHVFIGMGPGDVVPSFRCGVTECVADASRGHGVEINNSDECYVERCVITRSGANGIEPYHRRDPFLRATRLRDNLIVDADTAGISMHSDVGSDVSGNVIRGGGHLGILLAFGEAGPSVRSRNGVCELNDVRGSGRLAPDLSAGIYAAVAEGWVIRRNTVADNPYYGILLGGSNHTVSGNLATRNGICGLFMGETGHRIVGNDFSDNATAAAALGAVASVVSEATDVELRDNRVEDSRTPIRHREHYYIRGANVRFLGNRGRAITTTSGVSARIEATNAVVLGNEDVPDQS